MFKKKKVVTLVELIIAIVMFAVVVLGFSMVINFIAEQEFTQDSAVEQHLGITYINRFIKDKVSNSQAVSLVNPDSNNTSTEILIHPYDTTKPDARIYLDVNEDLYYCFSSQSPVTCERIAGNLDIAFTNPKDSTQLTNFKFLSFTVNKHSTMPHKLKDLIVTGAVYAKLGARAASEGYVYNLQKEKYSKKKTSFE